MTRAKVIDLEEYRERKKEEWRALLYAMYRAQFPFPQFPRWRTDDLFLRSDANDSMLMDTKKVDPPSGK